jgi:hypothetical protein
MCSGCSRHTVPLCRCCCLCHCSSYSMDLVRVAHENIVWELRSLVTNFTQEEADPSGPYRGSYFGDQPWRSNRILQFCIRAAVESGGRRLWLWNSRQDSKKGKPERTEMQVKEPKLMKERPVCPMHHSTEMNPPGHREPWRRRMTFLLGTKWKKKLLRLVSTTEHLSNVEDFPHINNLFPDASWRDPTV